MVGMEYVTHYRTPDRRRTPARVPLRPWVFIASLGFLVFALLYVSIGIRWHTYRARASLYAQREMESTFEAAHYRRAALNPGLSEAAQRKTQEYRRLAEMHARTAEECGRLRQLYEEAW